MSSSTPEEVINLADCKVAAILNTASGTCTPESAAELTTIFAEAGLDTANIWCGSAEDLPEIFEKFDKSGANVLVVLGGDGTIRSAAVRSGSENFMLIPLPGGTMNVLPRALYGEGSWQEILRAVLKNPRIKKISAGEVNGERFFISAICGAPALFTNAREAMRSVDVSKAFEYTKRAFNQLFRMKIKYQFNEMNEGETQALTITCPLVTSGLDDDRKVFESAVIEVNDVGGMFELATKTAFGAWRDSHNVAIVRSPQVRISGRGKLPIVLDGELVYMRRQALFTFIPDALTVLVPANEILS